ncbi:DUF6118 family protein [Asticcacaulis benevestitus]|uniref:Uncharacterized protein n=1 Tax=Asticcacaulis benevestitus DSM 16100 = ATCC BAA-896 TaxID=1121022 RepID=V4REG3_9CAUL|nr:DUF6118 family protein [Asticcacaulis benevestitus]ESQ89773.1 hypothetical protein ABENE_13605 [Asticcacaulis benevestitus DSM 16100 = ATCC BAA-896]
MTENTDIEAEPKSPAEAFEDLRREVAFMRKVIERMADDHRAAPNYSETLGSMADCLTAASASLDWLTQRPIVKTTAEQMAQQMSKAGNEARAADQQTIAEAAKALNDTNHDLSSWIASARKADDQDREVLRFSAIAVGVGAVVAIVLTMACLRLFPEHGAAWLLGKDRLEAGQQLMASADPDQWAAIQAAVNLERDNHQPIVECQKNAERTGKDQRCRVTVKAASKR